MHTLPEFINIRKPLYLLHFSLDFKSLFRKLQCHVGKSGECGRVSPGAIKSKTSEAVEIDVVLQGKVLILG